MFFQFSPVKPTAKNETAHARKENESEKVEVLSLAPFTSNPKLFFEDIHVGKTVIRKLLVENPTNHDVNLFITNHIPQELNVKLNPVQIIIEKKSNAIIEVIWSPLQEECSRHMITIEDGKRIRRDVPIAFKSILPKKPKTGFKQKKKQNQAPLKQKSPPKKSSPTKKYYSSKPPYISPKRYSPSRKKTSPVKKYSPKMKSPWKKCTINVPHASPEFKCGNVRPQDDFAVKRNGTQKLKGKENLPPSVINESCDSNVFISPGSATFRLDYLQPTERRETYVVNAVKDVSFTDSVFSDSLENTSPEMSPLLEKSEEKRANTKTFPQERVKRQPLGFSNQDNVSPNISNYIQQRLGDKRSNYNFEYKLSQMEMFCFTPVVTPSKRNDFSPDLTSTIERHSFTKNATETQNRTFELPFKSPNISTETYVNSNISAETYVKGNNSFETYVKSNLSGNTFTKDSSVGDVANLSFSPKNLTCNSFETTQPSVYRMQSLNGDNVRQVIEANLWPKNQPLSSIKEESFFQQSTRENNSPNKSLLKRKSDFTLCFTPPKRANVTSAPKDWSKTGGAAFRIAKKSTGLSLKQFTNSKIEEEADVSLTKRDTDTVIIQNPFLLAATNFADPFMTSHLHINEEWLDQQQVDFKKWLNALLTPPEELDSVEQVDVAKVWQECKKHEVDIAPTKETISNKCMVSNKLNSLRKSASNLFRSKEISSVLSKVVLAVETGKLTIREDKDVHLNLALKSEIMSMLLSYNPLWLRIGLETIYNEIIPLKSNSDVVGLSTFIANRLLKDPYLLKKHKLVHSLKYIVEFKKFFLKKFLVLVYFLDQAKNTKLIAHDPCLFCKNSTIKESKEMLTKLAREILAAVGDITKFLKFTGYVVTHVQTYIQEFDFAVKHLGVDLRDGVRLTRVMEIILMQENLMANLRVPAISRLQKIHNMKIVFGSLEKAGYKILYDIQPRDIVDGHKEKTLSFLWQIVYKFQAPLMVKSATTIQTWFRSLPVVLKRRQLEKVHVRRQAAATKIQSWYRRQKLARNLQEFAALLQKYLVFVKTQRAATKIQSYYKMYRCKKRYTKLREAVVNVQRFARGWLVRNVNRADIKSAVVIQRYVRMYLARKRYLELKHAVSVIQVRYRAKKQTQISRKSFIRQKNSAIAIQRWIRSSKLLKQQQSAYQALKTATVRIQRRFQANKLRAIEMKRYVEIKSATIRIQTWYRSFIVMRTCRKRFLTLKKYVIIVKERYVALKLMQVEKQRYQTTRRACITIQQHYKAYKETKICRKAYLELQTAVVNVQNRYRANKLAKIRKQQYEALRSATVLIQRRFRATEAMKIEHNNYKRLKEATVNIQRWFRATIEMRRCLTYYVSLKYAVSIFEERYQAKKLMEKECDCYQRLKSSTISLQRRYRALLSMRQARDEFLKVKAASVFVQRRIRANNMTKLQRTEYLELKRAVVVVQSRYRAQLKMKKDRRNYLKLQSAALTVQRQFRANVAMKTARDDYRKLLKYTVFVQERYKANKAMLEQRKYYEKLKKSTIFIQRWWRAKKVGKNQRKTFVELKKATLFAQNKWRANKLCHQEKIKYQVLRNAVINIQRRYMAKKLCEKETHHFNKLKQSAIAIQGRFRAKRLGEKCHQEYVELKTATILIQTWWRSTKLAEKQRNEFVELKKAVINIQQRWRATKLAQNERQAYLCLKNAAITIQIKWRAQKLGQYQKKQYLSLKETTEFVQHKWRANKSCKREQLRYQTLKTATITVQRIWRSKILAAKERRSYLQLKNAAVVLQRTWKARTVGKSCKQRYETLKNATVFIQRLWRANKSAKRERIAYETLKCQVVVVQRIWRAKELARTEKENYRQLKSATVTIQNWWRAQMKGKGQKIEYEHLRKATILIQRKWRANVSMKKERTRYLALKNAACVIQSNWKRKRERNNYLHLKNVTITIQQRWRAKKLCEEQKEQYDLLRHTTVFIQRCWRTNKLARIERHRYETLKKATVVLQQRFRAKKQAEIDRKGYLRKKNAAIRIQQRWRAKQSCKQCQNQYENLRKAVITVQRRWRMKKVCERTRNDYISLKKAAIFVQRTWKAKTLSRICVQRYTTLRRCVINIQLRFRAKIMMQKQRELYLTIQNSAIVIQRFYRSYRATKRLRLEFLLKKKSVVQLQSYIRGYIVRRKYAYYFTQEEREKRRIEKIERLAAIKIQALWRGHRSRSLDAPEILKIRERAKKATLKVEPQNTLGSRCKVALHALVYEKSTVFSVNKALEDLDYITRHSRDVCTLVAPFLPEQMYLMIKTTNRSLPEMTACIFSVNILINICKYRPTRPYSFFPQYLDNIVTVMMHWCDKEVQPFPSMCTLLWLFAHHPEWKEFIRSVPNIDQRFSKIQAQILRKQNMVKRAGIKGQSLFTSCKTLPLPSREPDWGLTYKHKPYIFTNSIHAFSSLLHILNL